MITYDKMIRNLQSTLARRSFLICKEDAFKAFYKSHGRVKEAAESKRTLKQLHKQQVQDKAVMKVMQELDSSPIFVLLDDEVGDE